jgi:predicted PurR-regulated permease PerM
MPERRVLRWRLRRGSQEASPPDDTYVELDASQLSGVFAAPGWLRDVGFTSWLAVGMALFLAGAVWFLSLVQSIVVPVITAGVIAAVASPLVRWLSRRMPRGIAAILVLLGFIALGALTAWAVIGGITSELGSLKDQLNAAKDTIEGWLRDAGVSPDAAANAKKELSSSADGAVTSLLDGVSAGLKSLSSLVFFLAMTTLSLIFLLSDGPKIRAWGERHMGVPQTVARTVTGRVLESLRGYFLGLTIIAVFNAVLVFVGALLLGVPLPATLAFITFVGAYVPYLGAWVAGAFAVLIALGGAGTEAAIGMMIVQLLANSVLQQLVQPFAMGAALGIHPLAVLIVTIGGGALFGSVGLILAAPLTAAATRISADLARAREHEKGPPGEPGPAPA